MLTLRRPLAPFSQPKRYSTPSFELRGKALAELHNGIDPAKAKRQAKAKLANTFGLVAKESHEKQSINWAANHAAKVWRQLEADILP